MISYTEVYKQAIALFDDPDITSAYHINKIHFYKMMYPYLNASASLFTQPFKICELLVDRTEPMGSMEVFESDGTSKTFTLGFIPDQKAEFSYMADGSIITGTYDIQTNSVTFETQIDVGKVYSFEAYIPGSFNDDFEITGKDNLDGTIRGQIISILARMLVKAWADDKQNFLLDIQNIIGTEEFKLHPSAAVLSSKISWTQKLDWEISQLQNKLSHNIRFASNSNWVRRYNR